MHITVADWITIIGALVTMEMAIGHGTIELTSAIPGTWVPTVKAWCNILAGLGGIVVTVLSRMIAGLVFIAAVLTLAAPADAGNLPSRVPTPKARPASAPAATPATPAAPAAPSNPLQGLFDLVNQKAAALNAFTIGDAQAAVQMAQGPDPAHPIDPAGAACYQAVVTKLQSAQPGSVLPKSLGVLQLLEAGRLTKLEVVAVQSGNDPVVVACAPIILDAQTTLLMLAGKGAIGVGTAGLIP